MCLRHRHRVHAVWKAKLLKSCLLLTTITKRSNLFLLYRHQTVCSQCLFSLTFGGVELMSTISHLSRVPIMGHIVMTPFSIIGHDKMTKWPMQKTIHHSDFLVHRNLYLLLQTSASDYLNLPNKHLLTIPCLFLNILVFSAVHSRQLFYHR